MFRTVLLWREVPKGAKSRTWCRDACVVKMPGTPEVNQDCALIVFHHNVFRRDISMNDML
jgi:hypothetical protein